MNVSGLSIILDFKKNEIQIPESVRDALGAPEELNLIFRKRDAMLGITEKIIFDYPYEKRNSKRHETMWRYLWDASAEIYRVKTECLLRALSKYIPDFVWNGVYTVSGRMADKINVVLFDLTDAEKRGGPDVDPFSDEVRVCSPRVWHKAYGKSETKVSTKGCESFEK